MKLEELFKKLSYGELSNLAVAVDASGTIKKEKQNQIVQLINEGLKKLHARLPISEENETVELTTSAQDHDFIDDALIVTAILTKEGQSVPFTVGQEIYDSVYVYQEQVHLPAKLKDVTDSVQITYRKRHATIEPVTDADSLAQVITLPEELEPALSAYIAFRLYAGMNTQDAQITAANYRALYEQSINDVLGTGLLADALLPMDKFDRRGFV